MSELSMNQKKMKLNESRIHPVSRIDNPRSWAIYGRSGTGKTTFASTFPAPILLLDIKDQGTDSVSDVKGLDVIEVESWDDIEEVYYFLKKNKKYKTVVFDTITQLQQLCLEHLITDKRKDASRVGDWGTLTRREWGDASAMMKEVITNYRDLPMETLFIAQERVTASDDDGSDDDSLLIPEVGPSAMKSVAAHLNAAVSIIGNTFIRLRTVKKTKGDKTIEKEEAQYCLRIGPNPVYTTKIRKPRDITPPAFVENPTYKDIIEIIKEKV